MRFLEFAPTADPRDNSDGDAVPPHLHRLANLWWNGGDEQDDYRQELAALGWTLQSDDDHVQLTHRDGTQYIISDDEFDGELFEISDELRRNYLHRADQHVSRRMDRMARVRDRLNKSYEIYHADRPAGGSQIVDRFEADTPALAQQYYERFIHDYESDVDFDLRLRRATGIMEITKVPTIVKRKREHLDVMPNEGQPIPRGEESDYLGDLVAEMEDGFELWSWRSHGTVTYYVYDTETRRCQLGTTGRPYKSNPDSFVVQGVYSGPKNRYRAADLYAFLIINRGLTLVSDYKQSEGGYRVWQELERRYGKRINVHGFDTRTDEPVNVSADPEDEPDTHVDRDTVKRAGPKMKKELGSISRDLRFVASAR